MARELSWDALRTFLRVIERGSIGAAARSLGVNHSTVLRHLAALESQWGQRLFERLPGGYVATTEGRELAEQLQGIGERIDAAQRKAGAGTPEARGTVRLTTSDSLAHGLLLPRLAAFRRQFPAVELQLGIDNALLSLTRREADVALRATHQPPDTLVGWRVGVVRSALYAAHAYLERCPDPGDTSACDWVLPDESLAHLDSAKWLRSRVPEARIACRMDSLFGVAAAVGAGLGVGLLQCPLGEGREDLVRLEGPFPELDTPLWVLTHPDLKAVRRVRVLVDYLRESLGSAAAIT